MYVASGSPKLVGCAVSQNAGYSSGGGVCVSSGTLTLEGFMAEETAHRERLKERDEYIPKSVRTGTPIFIDWTPFPPDGQAARRPLRY